MYSYLARQPILNIDQQLVAYELLFRDGEQNSFPNIDPNQATSNILTNNHLTLGVAQITGNLPAYINFHAETLIRHFPSFLDPKQVVLEILEDVEVSKELIKAVESLKSKGYQLALDDHDLLPIEIAIISVAVPASFKRTASSTAISQKGLIAFFVLARSTLE